MRSVAAAALADAIEAAARQPVEAEGASLDVVRRILAMRAPAALEELDAGLEVARQGTAELDAWLARPLTRAEPMDPYDAAALALAAAAAAVERLPPQSPRTATVISALATVANTCEKIMRGRPREVTPDEVETRIADRAKEARERIIQHTREAGKLLATRRTALRAWLREEVAPRVFAEYERLEAEMLGAP